MGYEGEEEEIAEEGEEEWCEDEEEELFEGDEEEYAASHHREGSRPQKLACSKEEDDRDEQEIHRKSSKFVKHGDDHWELRSRTPSVERGKRFISKADAPVSQCRRSDPKTLVEPKMEPLHQGENEKVQRHKDHVDKRRAELRALESNGAGVPRTTAFTE